MLKNVKNREKKLLQSGRNFFLDLDPELFVSDPVSDKKQKNIL